jgi:hypothetical protein
MCCVRVFSAVVIPISLLQFHHLFSHLQLRHVISLHLSVRVQYSREKVIISFPLNLFRSAPVLSRTLMYVDETRCQQLELYSAEWQDGGV